MQYIVKRTTPLSHEVQLQFYSGHYMTDLETDAKKEILAEKPGQKLSQSEKERKKNLHI